MIIRENIPLATLSTLRVGGSARYVIDCASEDDIREALAFANEQNLPWSVLGEGSNVLASDEGFAGVVLRSCMQGHETRETDDAVLITAGAGMHWDDLVRLAAERSLWGIENLAGIPGTAGAAPVQNIGAYGTEVKDSIVEVTVLDTKTDETYAVPKEACGFGYRESRFKHDKSLVILSITFSLRKQGAPALGYKDLAAYEVAEGALTTPSAIGDAVRSIRAQKFPDLSVHGTAGSFFKNPTLSQESYALLKERFAELPGFPNAEGVKIPLAFILDRVLMLRGFTKGSVSLFERQPLVLVANEGATAAEIDAFANDIAARVQDTVGIAIEREVQSFPSKQ
jgi:UDP-N-acetylmuramate dehydrogenase